jgi:peptidoglycan hydrolase-like protein with peptidoglycan-binding domain
LLIARNQRVFLQKVPGLILSRANAAILLSAALLCPSAFATTTTRHAAAHTSKLAASHTASAHARTGSTRAGKKTAARGHKVHGQQGIAPDRVTEIQNALISQHYLSKDADGRWDSTTEAAMQKYQADHGWQTKLMPDSRAIKALGLGPDYSNAINAKDSSFASPPPISTIPPSVAAGFAEGSGVVH